MLLQKYWFEHYLKYLWQWSAHIHYRTITIRCTTHHIPNKITNTLLSYNNDINSLVLRFGNNYTSSAVNPNFIDFDILAGSWTSEVFIVYFATETYNHSTYRQHRLLLLNTRSSTQGETLLSRVETTVLKWRPVASNLFIPNVLRQVGDKTGLGRSYKAAILLASRTPLRMAPATVCGKCLWVAWKRTNTANVIKLNAQFLFTFSQTWGTNWYM